MFKTSGSEGYDSVQSQLPQGYTLVDEKTITAKLLEVYKRSEDNELLKNTSKDYFCIEFHNDILNYKAFKLEVRSLYRQPKGEEDFYTQDSVGNNVAKRANAAINYIGSNRTFSIGQYYRYKYTIKDQLEQDENGNKTPFDIKHDKEDVQCRISIKNPNAGWFTNEPKYSSLKELLENYVLAIPPTQTQGGKSRRRRRKKRVSRKNRRSRKR